MVFHKKSTSPTVKTPDAEKHFRPNESGISLRNVHLFDPPAGSHPHCLKLLIVSVDWEPTREVSEPKRKRRKGQEDCDDVKPYAVYALTSHQEVEYFETGSSSAVQDGGYKPELTSSARARLLIYLPGPTCHPNDEIPSSLPPPPTGCPHCGRPLHSLTEEQRNKALKRLEEKIMPEISRTMHDAGASMDAGKIMKVFEEILQVSWADHCLRPDHRSLTKEQIREHIKQHHRLPGMRSEEDVKRFGIDVRWVFLSTFSASGWCLHPNMMLVHPPLLKPVLENPDTLSLVQRSDELHKADSIACIMMAWQEGLASTVGSS